MDDRSMAVVCSSGHNVNIYNYFTCRDAKYYLHDESSYNMIFLLLVNMYIVIKWYILVYSLDTSYSTVQHQWTAARTGDHGDGANSVMCNVTIR